MSHTRVKTTYESEGVYGSTEVHTLWCHHNHSCDCTTYYNEDGSVADMVFCDWTTGKDLWDAMERLWFPFKEKWNGELKDGVEYWGGLPPWETEEGKSADKKRREEWDLQQYRWLKEKYEKAAGNE